MRPTVCLCMIVKNEAAVIERCLNSVRDLIDTWVISDTGSTDGTQDLIRQVLADIPGELYEEPWVNFGHNRTLNLKHAHGKADYLLLIDADQVVRQVEPVPELRAHAYMLEHSGTTTYRITRLVRGDIDWRYEGVTHEYLTTDAPHRLETLPALLIDHFADGGSRGDKFERDERLLTADLERDPGNTRTIFYLAQTLRDLHRNTEAIDLYQRRAGMGGWDEEVYCALLNVGRLKNAEGDWPGAMAAFLEAWKLRPQRLEACYELVAGLRTRGHHHAAYGLTQSVHHRQAPDDALFVDPWVYRWGLLFEFSITAYWTGDLHGSLAACDNLLALPDLPPSYREQTLQNREFALQRLAALPRQGILV